MKKLSQRQQRILGFIEEFMDGHGFPPTVRDIQYACGVSSTSVVDYNLRILEREGYIRRSPEISRGIELVGASRSRKDTVTIPLLSEIAAGQPIPVMAAEDFSTESPLDTVEVPQGMLRDEEGVYALRVKGTSMIDALIDDGDIVVIRPTSEVRNGEMVVAWVKSDKEATLKRFYLEGNTVRLQPANSQMEPFFVDAPDVEVHGKVVAVLRNLA